MNRYEEALAEASEPSRAPVTYWRPKSSETIGGRIRFIGIRQTSFGDQLTIEIQSDSGEIFARAINGVLESELRRNNVDEGDIIALKYLGQKVAATSGRNYNCYVVRRLEAGPGEATQTLDGSGDLDEFKDDMPF